MLATVLAVQTVSIAACGERDVSTLTEPGVPSLLLAQENTTRICHDPDEAAKLLELPYAARAAHLRHGDYTARLIVDQSSGLAGDGVHFRRMTDAVRAARAIRIARGETEAAACRITIQVAPGTYTGSFDAGVSPSLELFPLIIDVPDITLRGALSMKSDEDGRPTGEAKSDAQVSTLVPDRPLAFLPNTEAMIVVVGHPGAFAGNGVVIEGFSFQSGRNDNTHGGMGIISLRASGLVIRGNRFERALSSAADLRSSNALIEGNFGSQLGQNCGFCLAGPGGYTASDNRLIAGGLGGIYVSPALAHMPFSLGADPVTTVEPDVLPTSATVTAVIRNNDIRGHTRLPIGFAVRVLAVGPNSSNVPQTGSVDLSDNDFVGNTFGLIVDAGFPTLGTLRKGDLDVSLNGNTIQESCQANLLVAFTRHTGALGVTSNPFLLNSTYRLSLGGDLSWDAAWFAHPQALGNSLIVDNAPVATGSHHSFDQNGCPGLI
jgi:hypothetical protein